MSETSSANGAGQGTDRPVVLITGASAGIGAATARRFAKAGWRIVAVARGQQGLDRLAEELSGTTDVATLAVDVSAADAGDRAVALAVERFGRLDALVNNAGSGKWAPVGDTSDELIEEVLGISLKAPFRFARAALKVMGRGASITNIGSTWGLVGGVGGGIYCVVKAGLVGLTRSLATDYGPKGIRTNLVAPGVIRTDMTDAYWDSDYFQRLNQEMTPFDRDGTPEDVANAIFFLASPEGSYMNSQVIALDGGWSSNKYLSPEALGATRAAAAAEG